MFIANVYSGFLKFTFLGKSFLLSEPEVLKRRAYGRISEWLARKLIFHAYLLHIGVNNNDYR